METKKYDSMAILEIAKRTAKVAGEIEDLAIEILSSNDDNAKQYRKDVMPVALSMIPLMKSFELISRALDKINNLKKFGQDQESKQEAEGKQVCYANAKSEHPC